MTPAPVLILGCGYTGRRVARMLVERGHRVIATSRSGGVDVPGVEPLLLDAPEHVHLEAVPHGSIVLHSIPLTSSGGALSDATPQLLRALTSPPARIVYLSTTGVYGSIRDVDENTVPAPKTPRETLRVAAERAVQAGPWTSLILRPAAIYGPGRGAHVSLARGALRLWGDGSNFVSRIHVDDLAAITTAALLSHCTGAFPVADDEPCRAGEMAEFCAELLGMPLPPVVARDQVSETRRADRRVDGRAIRRLLGVTLRYPTYREGIPASLTTD